MLPQTATKPLQARDEARYPRPIRVTEAELDNRVSSRFSS